MAPSSLKVFEQLVVGALQCNCYLVGDPATRQAIVIDPGDEADDILAAADRHGLTLVAAVATHAHFDHILAADAIRRATGIPFYLHAEDIATLARARVTSSRTVRSWVAKPLTVSTRFGIRSARRW